MPPPLPPMRFRCPCRGRTAAAAVAAAAAALASARVLLQMIAAAIADRPVTVGPGRFREYTFTSHILFAGGIRTVRGLVTVFRTNNLVVRRRRYF